jgi:hypothetical protein
LAVPEECSSDEEEDAPDLDTDPLDIVVQVQQQHNSPFTEVETHQSNNHNTSPHMCPAEEKHKHTNRKQTQNNLQVGKNTNLLNMQARTLAMRRYAYLVFCLFLHCMSPTLEAATEYFLTVAPGIQWDDERFLAHRPPFLTEISILSNLTWPLFKKFWMWARTVKGYAQGNLRATVNHTTTKRKNQPTSLPLSQVRWLLNIYAPFGLLLTKGWWKSWASIQVSTEYEMKRNKTNTLKTERSIEEFWRRVSLSFVVDLFCVFCCSPEVTQCPISFEETSDGEPLLITALYAVLLGDPFN